MTPDLAVEEVEVLAVEEVEVLAVEEVEDDLAKSPGSFFSSDRESTAGWAAARPHPLLPPVVLMSFYGFSCDRYCVSPCVFYPLTYFFSSYSLFYKKI